MSNTDNLAKDESLCNSCIHSRICRFEVPVGEPCEHYIKGSFMTNFDEIKKRIASMNADELIEFCGGDTCENVLCSFVSEGDCCGNNYKVSYDCGNCIKKFLQRETKG